MGPADQNLKTAFLPPGAARYLERLGLRLAGLALLALGGLFALSLASYRPQDPSLNTATDGIALNTLGWPGAVVSDLLVQAFGASSVLPVAWMVVWGLRLLAAQTVPAMWLRWIVAPFGNVLAAVAVTLLPGGWFWPPAAHPGGFAGRLLLDRAEQALAMVGLGGDWRWAVALLSLAVAVPLILFSLGIVLAEWRAAVRMAVAGWRLTLLGGRLARSAAGYAVGAARHRHEPTVASSGARMRHPPGPALDPGDPEPEEPAASPGDGDRGRADAAPLTPPRDLPNDLVAPRTPSTPSKRATKARQGSLPLETPGGTGGYVAPSLDFLTPQPANARGQKVNEDGLTQNARILESVLQDFGVQGRIVKVRPGPVVTLYELEPSPGTKTSRVIGLADDIARSMSALAVRIAVVPGQSVIGIELPNAKREMVYLHELLASDQFHSGPGHLVLVLGKDISGGPYYVDLARMPHLLIAGTTGSGKSVAVNTMILSLLYRLSPAQCRLIMIDPKMLELSVYDGIPHLLAPVVTEPGKAVVALKWAVREMENRYRAMSQLGVRNIGGYNQRVAEARAAGQSLNRTVQTGFDPETGKPIYEEQQLALDPLPFIVVVVDEMADLMMVAGKDVEAAIQRLAQMARAAGIHLIMATQRPSVDVITGTIKANFPTRISFQVTSRIDSRTILGEQGAEQLLGQGDMLYMAAGGRVTRVHGPFVSDGEVETVVRHLREQGEPSYIESVTKEEDEADGAGADKGGSGDDLYDQAVSIALRERKVSTSFIQRQLQIGYNRAARLVERMEAEGVVSQPNHAGKREVLPPAGGRA
ncbi:MAG: DNA translocase FtsK 4TM domain-containing protein [Alphaproteobacteria bacterium]|nr:DNA translocase FtsK 4TM domain-containing protein [Alphaproteobacteria bacterium]